MLLPFELELVVGDGELQVAVGLVVALEFVVHLLDLLLHVCDLELARLYLLLELLDLVVEHKLELFKLLVLFLQVIDALLLPKTLKSQVPSILRELMWQKSPKSDFDTLKSVP